MAPPLQHRLQRPRLTGDDAGIALIEFALILPVLAILVFGTIDLGRAFSLKSSVTNMAREGAFQLVVDACPLDGAKNAAKAENAELGSKVTVKIVQGTDTSAPEVTCPANGVFAKDTELTVVVTTKMSIIAPLIGAITGDPVNVTGTATARMP